MIIFVVFLNLNIAKIDDKTDNLKLSTVFSINNYKFLNYKI